MSSPTVAPPPLGLEDLDPDPHRQFERWLEAARDMAVHEPEAMALATAAADGRPSVRMVLLRGHGADGYVWFTNYASRKGRELAENPHAALVFHWAPLGRQVRVEGVVTRVTDAESDAYFATRHPGSQAGAWASAQSTPIDGRDGLERAAAHVIRTYAGATIPRPPHWGGFRLTADLVEFWQHRDDRMHDRFRYLPDGVKWRIERLAP